MAGKMGRLRYLIILTIIFTMIMPNNILEKNVFQEKRSYNFRLKNNVAEEIDGLVVENMENGIVKKEYTVRENDNLYKISKKLGQPLEILLINNPGLNLAHLSQPETKLITYNENIIIYKPGNSETLKSISEYFGVNGSELERLNPGKLNNGEIKGEFIYLPLRGSKRIKEYYFTFSSQRNAKKTEIKKYDLSKYSTKNNDIGVEEENNPESSKNQDLGLKTRENIGKFNGIKKTDE